MVRVVAASRDCKIVLSISLVADTLAVMYNLTNLMS